MTYAIQDKQFVAIAAGQRYFKLALAMTFDFAST